MAFARPLLCEVTARGIDGLGHVREVLLGVEAVDDLNRIGKVLVGEVPDPRGPIAEHGLARCAIEAAPRGLTHDARREDARRRVRVLVRRAFDRSRVAD